MEYVNHTLLTAQDHSCPLETYTVRLGRHSHVSARLARLSKLKANEFKKHRYSHRFKQLRKECKEELKNIKQKRIQAAVDYGDGTNSWLGKLDILLDPDGN